ncbi:Histone-lysine N-methyltransferase SETMAR [Eumeta japonica]|uniref:Histone-lysine N-methyltransferase SETMAR n=1 Tax=Eumeta variegata TaxID=151549 RepID=A0A4C1Z7D3_EUMVA|nr:Histone-lysine N-methyltransferase SETMAR [Eumeta japonica]
MNVKIKICAATELSFCLHCAAGTAELAAPESFCRATRFTCPTDCRAGAGGPPAPRSNFLCRKQALKTIVIPGLTRNKLMLYVWWDWKGIIDYELLAPSKTMNSDLYCQQLTRLNEKVEKKLPEWINRNGVISHNDNGRPHTSLAIYQKLRDIQPTADPPDLRICLSNMNLYPKNLILMLTGGCDCLQFPEDVPGWHETSSSKPLAIRTDYRGSEAVDIRHSADAVTTSRTDDLICSP